MKRLVITGRFAFKGGGALPLAVAICALLYPSASAQLAITEVMSAAAAKFGPSTVTTNSDFWELTNFGTNAINLKGYTYTDYDHPGAREFLTPGGTNDLIIRPFESVLFVRDNVSSNITQVQSWWGSCLNAGVQVHFYRDPGLSRYGDGLKLYNPTNGLIDSVRVPEAVRGQSFVYDPKSGLFGNVSVAGEGGACRAAGSDDVGSPGRTSGPIPLRIVREPQSTEVYSGLDVTFKVEADGMPRPRNFQWYFQGQIVPGAVDSSLTVSNANRATAGIYYVDLSNGIETIRSAPATLSLSTIPLAPTILAGPENATVLPDRSARFNVTVAALPPPTYQWFTNGRPVLGATNRSLLLVNVPLGMSQAQIRVRAENPYGTVFAGAQLFVTPFLDVHITEVLSYPNRGAGLGDHEDWFEVTNFTPYEVQLLNYRFNDRELLETAVTIREPVTLEAKESMIFVRDSSIGSFIEWWGVENLPPRLKVYPYTGFSLSRGGETLYLWTDSAELDDEWLEGVTFTRAPDGMSRSFGPGAEFGEISTPGENGAFVAIEGGDIGSPGYLSNPLPRVLGVSLDATGALVRFRANEGYPYQLHSTDSVGGSWTNMISLMATNSLVEFLDPSAKAATHRFYRILQIPR